MLTLKLITVGDSGVGKSCLLLRLTRGAFALDSETTIGIEFGTHVVTSPLLGLGVKLQVWDTAGQESFKSISRAYYRSSIGCLLCFDPAQPKSFASVENWLNDVRALSDSFVMLVRTKADMPNPVVTRKQAQDLATRHGLLFMETSAKTGYNVNECFTTLAEHVYKELKLDTVARMGDEQLRELERKGVKVGPSSRVLVEKSQDRCCA